MAIGPSGRVRFVTGLLVTFVSSIALSFPIEVANAPSSNLHLLLKAIRSAKKTVHLNIYEFSSPEVAKALVERMKKGVHVEILEEGQPVGGYSESSKKIQKILLDGMDDCGDASAAFYIMKGDKHGERRFRYNHAKYTIIDGKALVIGSENYGPGGQPLEGKKGNRGWQVFIQNASIAETFRQMFNGDIETTHGDVTRIHGGRPGAGWGPFAVATPWLGQTGWATTAENVLPDPSDSVEPWESDASSADPVTSPNTSLNGLVSLIGSARETLDLELMSFASRWGSSAKRSPLLDAVLASARRGVKVRVLLNDESAFHHLEVASLVEGAEEWGGTPQNPVTVKILNDAAKKEHLDITATIADLKAMKVTYIHNKGVIVDRDKVLISSINWNQNSVSNNREAGMVLKGRAIRDYYVALFDRDWSASAE